MINSQQKSKGPHKVIVIGFGMSVSDLTATHQEKIQQANILIGGKRHLAFFEHLHMEKRIIDRDLDILLEFIREQMHDKQIVVLASGDPLYFGIGERLINHLGTENITCYPNYSSISAAFSKMNMPWHDAKVISLHGRGNFNDVRQAIEVYPKVAILTSPACSPTNIAKQLMKTNYSGQFWVFERMGHSEEICRQYELGLASETKFLEPNIVICISNDDAQKCSPEHVYLGMTENKFIHEKNMITRPEVRVVVLSKLRLQSDHIFWDLGAGCGSVAIESSVFITFGKIIAVEKNSRRVKQIKQNKMKFQVEHLEIVQQVLPEGLAKLPVPDRVFIGGGGSKLEEIILQVASRLKPEGIIVLNTVLIESFNKAYFTLKQLGFQISVTQVQISRSQTMPGGMRMAAQNPVWIITGSR